MSGFVPGTQVGRFRIEAEIGRGGMGVVYRALDLVLQRPVALKRIAPDMGSDREALARFHREAAAAANLRHPHIAAVYEFGLHRDQPYIIFEWIEGRSLKELLRTEGRLSLERTRRLADPLAEALDYAHRSGVVHRDIKPGNILVDARDRAVIVDFGLAWLSHAPALSRPGEFFGTPAYIAPEQCLGDDLDGRADLYSLGVVVYEMLAGRPPFTAKTMAALFHKHVYVVPPRISTFVPSLPAWVDSALMRALAKDPAARFPTGAAFSQALHGSSAAESKPTLPVAVDDTQASGVDDEAATLPAAGNAPPITALSGTAAAGAGHPAAATRSRARSRAWLLALPLLLLLCIGLAGGAGWFGSALAGRGPAAGTPLAGAGSPAAGLAPTETAAPPASASAVVSAPTLVMTVTVLVTSSSAPGTPTGVGAAATAAASATAPTTSTSAPSSTAVPASTSAAASAAPPGATATLRPTATATPVPPTLTPLPSATASATAPPPSLTPLPSATPLPTQTASPLPSSTPTATLSPTPGCSLAGGLLVFSTDTELVWNLQNNEAAPVSLASLVIDWPDNPPAQSFQAALFGGIAIVSAADEQPPSVLPAEAAWSGAPEDLQLGPGSAKDLQLQFSSKLKNKGYTVTATFDNGCALSASN